MANAVGISYAQISKYEVRDRQPPAEVLKKIADTLGTTIDFLISGHTDEKTKSALKDSEQLQQFKMVEQMNDEDYSVVKRLFDPFITKASLSILLCNY